MHVVLVHDKGTTDQKFADGAINLSVHDSTRFTEGHNKVTRYRYTLNLNDPSVP